MGALVEHARRLERYQSQIGDTEPMFSSAHWIVANGTIVEENRHKPRMTRVKSSCERYRAQLDDFRW